MLYLIISIAFMFSGCAAMFNGRRQVVSVKTEPSGANIRFSTGETCTSPCVLELKRKKSAIIYVEMAGYKPINDILRREISPIAAVDLLFFWPGLIVDAMNGGAWDLRPNKFDFTLTKDAAIADATPKILEQK